MFHFFGVRYQHLSHYTVHCHVRYVMISNGPLKVIKVQFVVLTWWPPYCLPVTIVQNNFAHVNEIKLFYTADGDIFIT